MCLSLLIFPCTIKSRSSLLAPAHRGGPGERAVKRLWWCGGGVKVLMGSGRQSVVSKRASFYNAAKRRKPSKKNVKPQLSLHASCTFSFRPIKTLKILTS